MMAQECMARETAATGQMDLSRSQSPESNRKSGAVSEHVRWLVWFTVLGLASYVIASHYVVGSVEVSGPSMAPTINDSDYYFLDHLTYLWRAPQRGDIVVIRDPTDDSRSVKRVVGTPGELLAVKNGKIYLDGEELREPYLSRGSRTQAFSTSQQQVIRCRKGDYAVFGDNRGNSIDSRLYGPIQRANILGLVLR